MPTLRSRRLEQLLGGPVDETLTYAQVKGLIPDATEGPDLDFKRDIYTSSDKDRKALCGDVGALANSGGGVLVLGMDESDARAAKDTGVDISDDERRRLRQTVVGNVQPTPTFDIVPVEDPARPGTGFLVIAVARSANAPHAFVAQNKSLAYPKRIGTETVWLSEAEIAEAYRARFAGFADRIQEAARVEEDFRTRLNVDAISPRRGGAWVVVTLVPDLPGEFRIDSAAVNAFSTDMANFMPRGLLYPQYRFGRVGVRHRRLIAAGNYEAHKPYEDIAVELHETGTGSFAAAIPHRIATLPHEEEPEEPISINDEAVVSSIAAGLKFLAGHARDRAAAGGLATIRVSIWPTDVPVTLVHERQHGMVRPMGTHPVTEPPVADAIADLDDIAVDGRPMLSVLYRLASNLFQYFGRAEAPQITAEGNLRLGYWINQLQPGVQSYAEEYGVDVVRESV